MSKAKQVTTEEVVTKRVTERDSFKLQKLSMKLFEAKVARQKLMSKPEQTEEV